VRNVRLNLPCFSDCLVFLLRGTIFIEGQGELSEPGYAYAIQDEEWIGLGGSTVILVMEEGEMKGICAKRTKEKQDKQRTGQGAAGKSPAKSWNKILAKFRRDED